MICPLRALRRYVPGPVCTSLDVARPRTGGERIMTATQICPAANSDRCPPDDAPSPMTTLLDGAHDDDD